MRCRHGRAIPTIYLDTLGYSWCVDCGAIRQIRCYGVSSFTHVGRWIYPRGTTDVLRQLDKDRELRKNDTITSDRVMAYFEKG